MSAFNVRPMDLSEFNGRDVYLMQSHEDAEYIINEFKHRYIRGVDPNKLIDEICEDGDIDQDDLTDADVSHINFVLTEFCK